MNATPSSLAQQRGVLDAAVVIPLYNETMDTVVPTLEAIAVQEGVEDMRWAAVLVINNGASAPEEIVAVNRDTHTQLHALLHPDVALNPAHPLYRLHGRTVLVDAFSARNAPEVCNVGVARQLGADVAIPMLHDDGLLHCTDADTRITPRRLAAARARFAEQPDMAAATGPVEYRCDSPQETAALRMDRLLWRLRSLRKQTLEPKPARHKKSSVQLMPGCNMVVRKKAFPGFRPLAGGEDTRLSMDIVSAGGTIGGLADLHVQTSSRFSQRTHEQHGAGQWLLRHSYMLHDVLSAPTMSLEQIAWCDDLLAYLDECMNHLPTPEQWRMQMRRFRSATVSSERLTDDEIDQLQQYVSLLPPHIGVESNGFVFRLVERFAQNEDRFTSATIAQALQQHEASIRSEARRANAPEVQNMLDLVGIEFSLMEGIERPFFAASAQQSLHAIRCAHWCVRSLEVASRMVHQLQALRAGIALADGDDAAYAHPLHTLTRAMLHHACAKLMAERVNEFGDLGGSARSPQLFAHLDFYIEQLRPVADLLPAFEQMNQSLLERCKRAVVSRRPGPNPNALELAVSSARGIAGAMAQAVQEWDDGDVSPHAKQEAGVAGYNIPLLSL